MQVIKLRCDHMDRPLGFDHVRPLLSWQVQGRGINRLQSAYRLQVAEDSGFDQPAFDSGKLAGDRCHHRLELPLAGCQRYHWRVMVWDEAGQASPWSDSSWLETGRMGRPWLADFIGWDKEYPQLKGSFQVRKPLKQARAYACGLGLYRFFINGQAVGDEWLSPNFNAYDLWLQYQTYDITGMLKQGENAAGAWLGNGYYKGRVNWPNIPERRNIYGDRLAFIAEIELLYADGERELVKTDSGWQASSSPFDRTEIYDGEVFDARRFDPDWCKPGGGEGWQPVELIALDKQLLEARRSLPVKVMERLPVKQVIHTPAGETVFDFGQNFAGWPRFSASLPAGTRLHLQFGEALDQHGNFYRDNMRTALAELIYIADGKPAQYAPSFTFFGFRYMKVSGGQLAPQDVVGEVIYSDMSRTGFFDCDDQRVNRLYQNAMWSQKGNFVDSPTDCPQRDERMGWTGDAQVFCPTALMNMQAGAFFRKYLYDLKLEQAVSGFVPVVIPNILRHSGSWDRPTAAWADAACLIPWYLYLYYGDLRILEEQYDSMKAWVDYITNQGEVVDGVYGGFHLGDWLAQDSKDPDNVYGLTPPELVATAYYAWSSALVSQAAALLNKEEDARAYAVLSERVREAFRREFVSPAGRVTAETQTAAVVALHMDLLLPHQRDRAIQRLAHRLREDKMHLTTGFVGTPYLCPTLSENGLNEYAYALLLQEGCPSWIYEVSMGATTIWERWNSVRPDGSFGPVSMNSLNHYAFGSIVEWLYRYVCGLNPQPDSPGFRRALIRPMPHKSLGRAEAALETPYGRLGCGWQLSGGRICIDIHIPFGAQAEVVLPDTEGAQVMENGQAIDHAGQLLRGSGHWRYEYGYSGLSINRELPAGA